MKQYMIAGKNKHTAFKLSTAYDQILFKFGNDLIIYKDDLNDKSNIPERNPMFNYGIEKNALLGQTGNFGIRRIRVIQMQ